MTPLQGGNWVKGTEFGRMRFEVGRERPRPKIRFIMDGLPVDLYLPPSDLNLMAQICQLSQLLNIGRKSEGLPTIAL